MSLFFTKFLFVSFENLLIKFREIAKVCKKNCGRKLLLISN